MVISSSFKNSHVTLSLDSLPEDLLAEIFSCVAASFVSEFHNLELVSKSFQRLCNDPYVLHRISFHEIPLFPWFDFEKSHEKLTKLLKKCRKSGNPEAIHRKGLVHYFHQCSNEQRREKGLKHIANAADKGIQEAQYVYGLILICLGGKTKQNGFKILSSLRKPLMSNTIKEMEKRWNQLSNDMWWIGKPMMKYLKRSYVRENCNCDGQTDMFFAKNCIWPRYGEDNDMMTSSACEICLWHHVVKLFFDNIEYPTN